MSLRKTLTAAHKKGDTVFIPFIMAGDPGMAASAEMIEGLARAGAGLIELGVPFSEPVADGVTVQRAAERALAAGATLDGVLELVRSVRERGISIPICLFSYLNPVFRMGYDAFAARAVAAGANGALIVDLPPEAAGDYLAAMKKAGLETVFLCSPTTTPTRLRAIDAAASGFVYYVAREGVTGAQKDLPPHVATRLAELRDTLENPVAVGFGISTAAHVRQLRGQAAGIVVGSALVRVAEENPQTAAAAVTEKARELMAGLA